MMVKTDKGKEIRKYYIKLENMFNEVINEERLEYESKTKQLENTIVEKEKLLEEQELTIKKLKDEEFVDILYIAHNPIIQNSTKIGILQQTKHKLKNEDNELTRQNDIFVRLENHKSSNPQFEYLFTYETTNAKLIESLVKLFLKPFKMSKPEWIQCNYAQMKKVVDFCIMMYDNYCINDSIENLNEFISRYRSNLLINTNKVRVLIEKPIYEDYVKECIFYGPQLKVSNTMICNDFYEWYKLKYPKQSDLTHIKLETGNLSTAFQAELAKNIASITNIEYLEAKDGVTLSDKKRGIYISKSAGFKGFELKSMSKKIEYFPIEIYKKYVNEFIVVDNNPRHKVARVEILTDFLEWIKTNNYICKHKIYCQTNVSSIFRDELIKSIEDITKLTIKDVCKLSYTGCFVGMTHSKFLFIGNERLVVEMTDYHYIEKQITNWLNVQNKSNIGQFFRKIISSPNKKLLIADAKLTMKDVESIVKKSNKTHLIFSKNETEYFLTINAKKYLTEIEQKKITNKIKVQII